MGNLFKAPKAPTVINNPPVEQTSAQQEQKQQQASLIRDRALKESASMQGQFKSTRTGLRL